MSRLTALKNFNQNIDNRKLLSINSISSQHLLLKRLITVVLRLPVKDKSILDIKIFLSLVYNFFIYMLLLYWTSIHKAWGCKAVNKAGYAFWCRI